MTMTNKTPIITVALHLSPAEYRKFAKRRHRMAYGYTFEVIREALGFNNTPINFRKEDVVVMSEREWLKNNDR